MDWLFYWILVHVNIELNITVWLFLTFFYKASAPKLSLAKLDSSKILVQNEDMNFKDVQSLNIRI